MPTPVQPVALYFTDAPALHGADFESLHSKPLVRPRCRLASAEPTNAFAGGVVRIEAPLVRREGGGRRGRVTVSVTRLPQETDLEWVGNTFAEHMGPRTLRLIREVGGRRWQALMAALECAGVWPPPSGSPHSHPAPKQQAMHRPRPHCVPPLHDPVAGGGRARRVRLGGQVEFRQAEPPAAAVPPPHPLRARPAPAARDGGAAEGLLLAPAHDAAARCRRSVHRLSSHLLVSRYTRLHGAVGDEAWRTGSAGSEYVVRGEGGATRCARLGLGGKESVECGSSAPPPPVVAGRPPCRFSSSSGAMARPRAVLSTTCLKTRGVGAMHSTTYAASHAPLCLPHAQAKSRRATRGRRR